MAHVTRSDAGGGAVELSYAGYRLESCSKGYDHRTFLVILMS